jgi:hypothetical protein
MRPPGLAIASTRRARTAATAQRPDDALMLSLTALLPDPLGHGQSHADHSASIVGVSHAANGMERVTPGRHAKVEHRWNLFDALSGVADPPSSVRALQGLDSWSNVSFRERATGDWDGWVCHVCGPNRSS